MKNEDGKENTCNFIPQPTVKTFKSFVDHAINLTKRTGKEYVFIYELDSEFKSPRSPLIQGDTDCVKIRGKFKGVSQFGSFHTHPQEIIEDVCIFSAKDLKSIENERLGELILSCPHEQYDTLLKLDVRNDRDALKRDLRKIDSLIGKEKYKALIKLRLKYAKHYKFKDIDAAGKRFMEEVKKDPMWDYLKRILES